MDISVALGGGGAKGNSHIGVLRLLEKEGYRIRAVAGTSFGGVVAAVYAAGNRPDEVEEIFCRVDQRKLYSRGPKGRPSILGLDGVAQWLQETLGDRTFQDLKVPCAMTAVDLIGGQEVTLSEGLVRDAVLATIALPGIFPSFEANGWDWSYHAFREWSGWSVEHGPDRADTKRATKPTDRERLLQRWFSENQKPKW